MQKELKPKLTSWIVNKKIRSYNIIHQKKNLACPASVYLFIFSTRLLSKCQFLSKQYNYFPQVLDSACIWRSANFFPLEKATPPRFVTYQSKIRLLLGINIMINEEERCSANFNLIGEKTKKQLNQWLQRDLSLKERVWLTKAEGLSRLTYYEYYILRRDAGSGGA